MTSVPGQTFWKSRAARWGMVVVTGIVVCLVVAGYYCTTQLQSAATHNDFGRMEALTLLNDPQLRTKLIRTAEADYLYNCHGWTFTGGAREVEAEEVEQRLEKDYQTTTQPKLGDIVVYRDHRAQVMHSGIVKAVGDNGFMLIESKWGTSGRFIHEPTISRTFTSFAYYQKLPEVAKAKPAPQVEETDIIDALCDDQ